MNLIVNAVASIVDAHTHYLDASGQPDYRARIQHGRAIRSRSVLASFGILRKHLESAIHAIRARVAEKREVDELLKLKDYLLEDIGLSRAELLAVQAGVTSLAELYARNRQTPPAALPSASRNVKNLASAANEADFGLAECA